MVVQFAGEVLMVLFLVVLSLMTPQMGILVRVVQYTGLVLMVLFLVVLLLIM